MMGKVKGLIDQGTEVIMALVIVGVMAGAGAIALGALYTQAAGTGGSTAMNTTARDTIGNASTGILNLTSQMGTIGTVAAVGLVIAVIVAAFAVFLFRHRE